MDWAGAAIWCAYLIAVLIAGRLMGAHEGRS